MRENGHISLPEHFFDCAKIPHGSHACLQLPACRISGCASALLADFEYLENSSSTTTLEA